MKSSPQQRRHRSLSAPKPQSVDIGALPRVPGIDPTYISSALSHVREVGFESYVGGQRDWLRGHVAPLLSAIEIMYEATAKTRGPEIADASLQGAYLGGSVVRSSVEVGAIDTDTCFRNLMAWDVMGRAIVYDNEPVPPETLSKLFGDAAAAEFADIRHPAARTVCSIVVCVTMAPPVR